MKKFILGGLCILVMTGCKTQENEASIDGDPSGTIFSVNAKPVENSESLMGIWESPPQSEDGITASIRARFEEAEATLAVRCSWPSGEIYYAQASSFANYFQGSYSVIDYKENKAYDVFGNVVCAAEIEPLQLKESDIKKGKLKIKDLTFKKISEL